MKKKIIIAVFIIITIFQAIIPINANAFDEQHEISSVPAKIEKQKSEDIVSETSGLDVKTGLILEPAYALVTVVIDSLMEVLTAFMTTEDFEPVMVNKINELSNLGEAGTTYTIEDMTPYENALGILNLEYPNFAYSPEEIFAGNLDLLDINFLDDSNEDSGWQKIRSIVSSWYKVLRMVAIIGLLSVLIYTGIKIMISSNTKDKAKYKELLVNWFIAVILAFTMHYIMAFILNVIEELTGLLQGLIGVVEVDAGGTKFKTNLIGLARFQMQQQHFSAKITYLTMYTALITYTFKFTFLYFKRVLKMAFLTVISPIVALTYPLDKMEGKAKGFEMWLKEYIYNALLQPMHYILYYILVTSSLALASKNMIYAIAALAFISHAEKLLQKIFGFDKATAGTISGIAGAYTTGAIASAVTKFARNPLHPFGGGKGSGGKSGGYSGAGGNGNDFNDISWSANNELNLDVFMDTDTRAGLATAHLGTGANLEGSSESGASAAGRSTQPLGEDSGASIATSPTIPGIDDFIYRYRAGLPLSISELGGLSFNDDDPRSIEEILQLLSDYQRELRNNPDMPEERRLELNNEIEKLESILRNRVTSNEMKFTLDGRIPLQYADAEERNSSELMEEILRLNELSNNVFLPSNERRSYARQSEKLLKILKRRMAQNEYIQGQGGVQALLEQERNRLMSSSNGSEGYTEPTSTGYAQPQSNGGQRINESQQSNGGNQGNGRQQINRDNQRNEEQQRNTQEQESRWERFKEAPVTKGLANVGKTILEPLWDVDKDVSYNGQRAAEEIAKVVGGIGVGIVAATVQAGISITDGKYSAKEGIATIGAGIVGVSKIGQGAENLVEVYKEGAYAGDDERRMKEYGKQWFNRDDVISSYNKAFPGKGKEMRRRAVNNYLSRGITDVEDQKKAIKYANQLKTERGINEEEADRIAVATLRYKKSLSENGNYTILFDDEKREKYLDAKVKAYTGSASSASVRRLHDDFIENVRDFDRANR